MAAGDAKVPTTPPFESTRDWGAIVRESWGDEWLKHEIVYRMRGGRTFESSDYGTAGIYRGTST